MLGFGYLAYLTRRFRQPPPQLERQPQQ